MEMLQVYHDLHRKLVGYIKLHIPSGTDFAAAEKIFIPEHNRSPGLF